MRSVPPWKGKTYDDPIPNRVKIRLFQATGGRCAICTRLIYIGMSWVCDHMLALANGGRHAEDNLQVLCEECHKTKTRSDVAMKALANRIKTKHLGLKRSRNPMPGSRASGWKRKMSGEWVRRKNWIPDN